MNSIINFAYGGDNVAQEVLVNKIREFRRILKGAFENYIQKGYR